MDTGNCILHSSFGLDGQKAVFANEGRILAVIASDGRFQQVVFWDLTQPDKPPEVFKDQSILNQLEVSPDQRWVATCSQNGSVVLYDALTMQRDKVLHGRMQGVDGLVFSPDGKTLVSGAGGFEAIKLWHIETGQELLTLPGKGSLLSEVQFMENGNTILAGRFGQRGVWQMWRAPSWEEIAAAEAQETAKNQQP